MIAVGAAASVSIWIERIRARREKRLQEGERAADQEKISHLTGHVAALTEKVSGLETELKRHVTAESNKIVESVEEVKALLLEGRNIQASAGPAGEAVVPATEHATSALVLGFTESAAADPVGALEDLKDFREAAVRIATATSTPPASAEDAKDKVAIIGTSLNRLFETMRSKAQTPARNYFAEALRNQVRYNATYGNSIDKALEGGKALAEVVKEAWGSYYAEDYTEDSARLSKQLDELYPLRAAMEAMEDPAVREIRRIKEEQDRFRRPFEDD